MKTILFLIPSLGGGGAERVLINLVNNLDKSKYKVTVQTLFDVGVNRKFLNHDVNYIGGIAAAIANTTISKCGNTGNVSTSTSAAKIDNVPVQNAGGIVGLANGSGINIEDCYNTGNITSYQFAAGIAVSTNYNNSTTGSMSIKRCYTKGKVTTINTERYAGIAFMCYADNYSFTYENNYFGGTYSNTANNGTYRKHVTGGVSSTHSNANVSDFTYFQDAYTQDNHGLLAEGNWLLKWQVPQTEIRHPFDVYTPTGEMDIVVYGADSNFTYQWYNATDRTSEGTLINGATSPSISLPVTVTNAGVASIADDVEAEEDEENINTSESVQMAGNYYYCVVTGIDSEGKTVVTR